MIKTIASLTVVTAIGVAFPNSFGQSDVCRSVIEAVARGDADAAEKVDIDLAVVQPDQAEVRQSVQIIQSSIDAIRAYGGGLPVFREIWRTFDTKDQLYILIEKWRFPNETDGYAGCIRARLSNDHWITIFKTDRFESDLEKSLELASIGMGKKNLLPIPGAKK